MHRSAYERVEAFRDAYLKGLIMPIRVLDLGSQDANGTLRPLFDGPGWEYQGLDIAPGKNVDIVLNDPYRWDQVDSESADVLVSVSTFEHIEYFWQTMREVARVLKPGGLCCIVVPSSGVEHKYPVDCWRFYPDGLRAMARFAQLEVLTAHTDWRGSADRESNQWHDSTLICRKSSASGQFAVTARHPHLKVRSAQPGHENLHFVCVSHKPDIYQRHVGSNRHIQHYPITLYDNSIENAGIPERYNHFIEYRLPELGDTWVVFMHHDLEFHEDLGPRLSSLGPDRIYGPVGARLSEGDLQCCLVWNRSSWWRPRPRWHRHFFNETVGEVKCHPASEEVRGSRRCGASIIVPERVDTLDCCCLIVHSNLLRKHRLRFNPSLPWHLYSEDFSLTANTMFGIKTFAVNLDCTHHSSFDGFDQSFYDHSSVLLRAHSGKSFASTCMYHPLFPETEDTRYRGRHIRVPMLGRLCSTKSKK